MEFVQAAVRLLDRIREHEIVRANYLAAERSYAIGNIVEQNGVRYRVTRQHVVHTVPWSTIIIYGVPL